jgi:hypothetical protein
MQALWQRESRKTVTRIFDNPTRKTNRHWNQAKAKIGGLIKAICQSAY